MLHEYSMADRVIRIGALASPVASGSNAVFTTKYTAWNFIPKFLSHQFSQANNLFFLSIAIMQ